MVAFSSPPSAPVAQRADRDTLPVAVSAQQSRWVLAAAAFLVSGPVFVEAPLTREFPLLCLALSLAWIAGAIALVRHPKGHLWGDLLLGFAATWLTGALYWGWLRWEPLWHLPVEALGLPLALVGLRLGWGRVGCWFYLGSLLGTVATDSYFYLLDLFPFWRAAIAAEPTAVGPILHAALAQMNTPAGWLWAGGLSVGLLSLGLVGARSSQVAHRAFGGALLSTLLVDGLFWLVALA